MDASTINGSTFTVKSGTIAVTGTVSYDASTRTATFTPSPLLSFNASYTVTLTTGVKDAAGNPLAANYNWTFNTVLIGDINGDASVDLKDAILAMRFLSGMQTEGIRADYTVSGVDVNGDGRLGMEEVLYILQKVAGIR